MAVRLARPEVVRILCTWSLTVAGDMKSCLAISLLLRPLATKAATSRSRFDKTRKKVVSREFNGEGYVNQYVLDEIGDDGKRLTFVTESVENGMPGLRARIIIHLDDETTIREDFDLAFPGKDFKTCVKNKLTKS